MLVSFSDGRARLARYDTTPSGGDVPAPQDDVPYVALCAAGLLPVDSRARPVDAGQWRRRPAPARQGGDRLTICATMVLQGC